MAELPSGTVTFLLTDVEGSTALWEEAPEAMREALARHDSLFDEAVRRHGGVHIRPRGEGDSRFAVFSSAADAVAAAVAIQRALAAEPWATPRPVRVRIGIHSGEAELRDGDYYGSAVNRCARLRGIGHGGQTLLSGATEMLTSERLPSGTSLLDLGQHDLEGLVQPEHVFQVVVAGVAQDFPVLTSRVARRNNLPIPPTPLLGRDREVQVVRNLLLRDEVRLVTLTGPGGTGKTRLGLQVASVLLEHFPDGVFLVPLAPISDPELVISTVAQNLGLRETGGHSLRETVTSYLKEKLLLLLLDNFEQVLPAAPLVADLLATCPTIKVLATSRAVLHLRSEREYAVPPLPCPDPKHLPPLPALSRFAAVALFVQRAAAVKGGFSVTDENAPAVAEICRRLDGLPLAIELAAARTKLLTPAVLVTRLEQRLPLLTGGARDLPERQRTLRDTIAWSFDLLDESERGLFRRLSVFVGGFTVEAAEAVCTPAIDSAINALDHVASLVDKSLLRHEDADGKVRFTMLETIREYALEKLEASGEAVQVRRLFAEHCLALAEIARPQLTGMDQGAWLACLEAEHDNMRAVLVWSLEATENAQVGLRLACALYRFWQRHGHVSEGREWLARTLAWGRPARGETRARTLNAAGVLARAQGECAAAQSFFEQSLSIYREIGDRWGVANALHNLASVVHFQGDYERATVLLDESLAIWRVLDDRWGLAMALTIRGSVARDQGNSEAATALEEESLRLLREVGDLWGIAGRLGELGVLARTQGDLERATTLLNQALTMRGDLGDRDAAARLLAELGEVAHAQHDPERASALYHQSLRLYREMGNRWGPVVCFERLAAASTAIGQPVRAAVLLGAAEVLRVAIGEPVPPLERAGVDQVVASARALLGEEDFAAAWAEGHAMTLEQAVAYALDEQPSA